MSDDDVDVDVDIDTAAAFLIADNDSRGFFVIVVNTVVEIPRDCIATNLATAAPAAVDVTVAIGMFRIIRYYCVQVPVPKFLPTGW